jgi:hypothetical protein
MRFPNEPLTPHKANCGANAVALAIGRPLTTGRSYFFVVSVRANELGFPVLSDINNETAAASCLRFKLPDQRIRLSNCAPVCAGQVRATASWGRPANATRTDYLLGAQAGCVPNNIHSSINFAYLSGPSSPVQLSAGIEQRPTCTNNAQNRRHPTRRTAPTLGHREFPSETPSSMYPHANRTRCHLISVHRPYFATAPSSNTKPSPGS